MAIDLSTFWGDWDVVSGNTEATNQYEFWKGIEMSDGQILNNQYEFFTYHNTTRYEWFKNLQSTYPEVYDEYTFYKNTNDPNIFDMFTFYEFGAQYLVPSGPPPPTYYTWQAEETESGECSFTTADITLYSDNPYYLIGYPLYTDTALTIPFVGNPTSYYTLQLTGVDPSPRGYAQIGADGIVTTSESCFAPFSLTNGYETPTDGCGDTNLAYDLFVTDNPVQVGSQVYSTGEGGQNTGLFTSGNDLWYNELNQIEQTNICQILYDATIGAIYIDCPPLPTPTPTLPPVTIYVKFDITGEFEITTTYWEDSSYTIPILNPFPQSASIIINKGLPSEGFPSISLIDGVDSQVNENSSWTMGQPFISVCLNSFQYPTLYNYTFVGVPDCNATPTPTPSATPQPTPTPTPTGDADAQAYLAAVVASGGTVDGTITTAVNTLFGSLKTAGVYSKLDILMPMVGEVKASMLINAKAPTNTTLQWTEFGAPLTYDVSGITGNMTGLLKSNFKLSELTNTVTGACHFGIYYNQLSTIGSGGYLNGYIDTQGAPYQYYNVSVYGGSLYGGQTGGGSVFGGSHTPTTGWWYAQRSSDSSAQWYSSDSLIQDSTDTVTFRSTEQDAYFALFGLGWISQGPNGIYTEGGNARIATVTMGSNLTSGERTALYDAINTFNTTLGRP